jgi:flavodoxin
MKAIIYASVHHGNTKKVVEAIAKECEVELIGGLAKGHPDDKDLENAVAFFKGLEQ